MKNYFTIIKSKNNLNNNQTKKDYDNLFNTFLNENPTVDCTKKEVIVKQAGELFTVPDEDVLRQDIREYVAQEDDPFTSKNISSSLQSKLLQSQVLKDKSFNADGKIPINNKKN
jgi:hypothetical protein